MVVPVLKENRVRGACTSGCSFSCCRACPCVGWHTGPEQPLSSGRAGEVQGAHLPCCAPPLPPAEFTSPSTSWPVSVAVHALGFSRFSGGLSVNTLTAPQSGSLLLPAPLPDTPRAHSPLQLPPSRLFCQLPACPVPILRPSWDFLFLGWSLVRWLVSAGS